ncbi:MAG: SUMF1/EgtB/PvdO family nonheme iron enzyme [Gammaproteobacteria bacterium]|nr:SUMF1/EgtB/PvdO family nonheme iron enzyme [Gammaproteobacteria bacterium]
MNEHTQPSADGDHIAAVQFRPTPAATAKRRAWLNPWRIAGFVVLVAVVWFLWFIFTAKSVRFEPVPASSVVEVDGGFAFRLGDIHLMREGDYRVRARAEGYVDLTRPIGIGGDRNQTISLTLTPLPGRVTFAIDPPDATVIVSGGEDLRGTAPVTLLVPAGPQAARVSHPRYEEGTVEFEVTGRDQPQTVTLALRPNWADVTLPTTPPGAQVRIDDDLAEVTTPGPIPILAGEHRIVVALPGYKPWTDIIYVEARQPIALPPIVLDKADGTLEIESSPGGAGVTVGGVYAGVTPLSVGLDADKPLAVSVFKVGHAPRNLTIELASGQHRAIDVTLTALTGDLSVETRPKDAELWIDNEHRGLASGVFTLAAVPHIVEIRKEGYAGFRKTVVPQPGLTKQLNVELLTLEEARLRRLKAVRSTGQGHELVLLSPGQIQMGASRREPGRRANEVIRTVDLTRLFYLSRHEVTNGQFRVFATGHSSGQFENRDLDQDTQPVVGVSWNEVALYCNWLSELDDLQPFYREEFGKIVGFNSSALGYRLPTEAEWAWSARHVGAAKLLRFPWGDQLPPPDKHGNYADQSAAHTVGRIIFGYNDNYIASAPVGTFPPNNKGVYDLGGNVAEWVHDFYEIPDGSSVVDPLGPRQGDYHVIRGASWMHGTVSDLRLSGRDYGIDGRPDVGFRIARFAE